MAKQKEERSVLEKLDTLHDKVDQMSDSFEDANEKIHQVCSFLNESSSEKKPKRKAPVRNTDDEE